ncbi:MAG TPA: hypothetical protein VF771_20115 [Longimicrobiaceae bacterium]
MVVRRIAAIAAGLLWLAACTPSPAPGDGGRSPDAPPAAAPPAGSADAGSQGGPAEADTGRIARLEREARAMAHAEGCAAGQCRTAPVGSRPCGGPRTYIVYCAARTDSAALFAKLAELARAEEEFNRRNQLASTCEFRAPPNATLTGGRCTAAPPNELPPQ